MIIGLIETRRHYDLNVIFNVNLAVYSSVRLSSFKFQLQWIPLKVSQLSRMTPRSICIQSKGNGLEILLKSALLGFDSDSVSELIRVTQDEYWMIDHEVSDFDLL